ncbi:MAG: putative RNA binding protein YcfA (HicA-like mRNA interferase family) [Oceanicoccus sp.]|jgi:predicted RNA binding protein YcfA (HicA-like mRNA interferase family)
MSNIEATQPNLNYEYPGPTKNLRSFFGEQRLEKLSLLLSQSILPEIDALVYEEEIAFEEAAEYAMHLTEYHELRTELRLLADEFACAMRGKLPRYFSRIFSSNGTLDVKKYNKHFNGLRLLLFELLQAYSTREKITGWNGRILEFFEFLDQSLILHLRDFTSSHFSDPASRIQALYGVQNIASNTPHPFTQETGEKSPYFLVVNGVSIMEHFAESSAWQGLEEELVHEIPAEELHELLEEAEDLTQFREMPVRSLLIGNYEIAIKSQYSDRIGVRSQYLASVVIADRATRQSILDFTICRSTGDIFIPTTNVCLGSYMGAGAYHSLRAHLFKLICNELSGKPENLESNITVVTKEIQYIHEELKSALPQEEQAQVLSFPIERQKPVFNLACLRNLSSQKVLSALSRLLGSPVRIKGSHHFFRTRGGGVYPISIHKGSSIKTGLLRACIEKMGLDPIEFYEAL